MQGTDGYAQILAAAALGRVAPAANTVAVVADSYGWYASPQTANFSITSTTAGQTSITVSQASQTGYLAVGDRILLVNNAANPTMSETVIVGDTWGGPGSTSVPLTSAVQNSGLVVGIVYAARLPSVNSWFSIAMARLGQPLAVLPNQRGGAVTAQWASGISIWGISGGTSSQLNGSLPYTDAVGVTSLNNYEALAIASGAKYIVRSIGTNDVAAGVSAATIIANDASFLSACTAAGRIPVLFTIPPRGSLTSSQYAVQQQVNSFRRGLARKGVLLADINRWLADPLTGQWLAAPSTGLWGIPANVYYTNDSVHPVFFSGAWAMASALVDALQSVLPPVAHVSDIYNPTGAQRPVMGTTNAGNFDLNYSATYGANPLGNFLGNGQFSGTSGGGTLVPGSGSAGTGWNVNTLHTPTSGSFTVAGNVARPNTVGDPYARGYSQTVAVSQGTGTDYGAFELYNTSFDVASAAGQAPGAFTWQIGELVYGAVWVNIASPGGAGTTHETYATMQVSFYNSAGTQIGATSALKYITNSLPAYDPAIGSPALLLRTPPCPIPPNTAKVQMYLTGVGVGTFTFTDAEIRAW